MDVQKIVPVDMDSLSPLQAYAEYFDKVPKAIFYHLKRLSVSDWRASQSMLGSDAWTARETGTVIIGTIVLLLLRWVLTTTAYKPITRRLGLAAEHAGRFPESMWKVGYYLPAWLVTSYLLYRSGRHPYMTDLASAYNGFDPEMEVPLDLYMVYMVNLSFYSASVVTSFLFDRCKGDFYVMFSHHLLTIALLVFSYAFRYHRIGLAVLYVHDLPDFLLDFAKLFNYCKKRNGVTYPTYGRIADGLFAIFLCSWVYMRFYLLSTRVLYSTGYVSQLVVTDSVQFIGFNAVLHTLLCMHVYWFSLAIQVIIKVMQGGAELDDCRDEEQMKVLKLEAKLEKNGVASGSLTESPRKRRTKID